MEDPYCCPRCEGTRLGFVFHESRTVHDEWDIEWRCLDCKHGWMPQRCPCCGEFGPMQDVEHCPVCGAEWPIAVSSQG
jgi:hypothetical protein